MHRPRLPRPAPGLLLAALLAGCGGPVVPPQAVQDLPPTTAFSAAEALRQFDAAPEGSYRLGEGDLLTVQVWDRGDLSGQHTVGPDGVITLPVAGSLKVAGLTREEAAGAIKTTLTRFYADVTATVRVDAYVSNRIFVLGRVRSPGAVQFTATPSLLEALSRTGGLAQDATGALSHCAVIRGRDRVAWIDLRRLLENGDLSLNLNLKANDVVLVPEWEDQPVYVLGQVARVGAYRWSAGMTLLDALSRAGGTTRDAAPSGVQIVRPAEGLRFTVSLDHLIARDGTQNIGLRKGDIIYVPTNTLADVGYIFQQLSPFSWVYLAGSLR